jgi:conjugative transposon TraN protein
MDNKHDIYCEKIDLRLLLFSLFFVVFSFCISSTKAQNKIRPINLQLNDNKYLFIKFPAEVNYADMGSYDLTAKKCLDRIIKLKATTPRFEKTNFSVVTTDGKYYSFIVEYNSKPSYIAVDMANVKDSIMSTDIIPSTEIEVSDIHTTHVILPTKVADIALGHEEVISEKADPTDNIVKVKSVVDKKENFTETSITVVSIDGNIYPMTVGYAKNPKEMSISFSDGGNALFNDMNVDDDKMRKLSEWIIQKGQYINDLGIEENKMMFLLSSVFTDQDIIAFHLYAKNKSKIDYPIDFVKAHIADKKTGKRYLTQEEELYPFYSYYSGDGNVIHGKDDIDIVFFYKKFTISKEKILYFELYEENGGRNLRFNAPYKTIINAEVMEKID